jgi:CheY-like chemotaxis protein
MNEQGVVLIVEDSDTCAATLEIAVLAVPGIAVARVASALEALKILENGAGPPVRAMITDLQMPRMDGFELLEKIRSDPRHEALPVVIVSGDPDPRNPDRASRLGASAYFTKPFSPAKVRHKLEELLNGPAP